MEDQVHCLFDQFIYADETGKLKCKKIHEYDWLEGFTLCFTKKNDQSAFDSYFNSVIFL